MQIHDWESKGHVGEYWWSGIASTHFWISPTDDSIVIALSQEEPFNNRLKDILKPLVYDILKAP